MLLLLKDIWFDFISAKIWRKILTEIYDRKIALWHRPLG